MQRVRIGFVGLRFGCTVIDGLLEKGNPSVQLAALCDTNPVRLKAAVEKYGVPGYESMDEMLSRCELDAVGLYTPPAGRAALMERAMDAGKHIMTTKPFELDPARARAVLSRARREGIVIRLNSPAQRENEYMRVLKEAAREHDLGRPVGARYDEWVNYLEKPDDSWYDSEALCPVAPITRLGIYVINDLCRLFGRAERVNVLASRLLTGRPTADNAALGILFESGVIANIFVSFCVHDGQRYKSSMIFNYERGTFYISSLPHQVTDMYGLEMILAKRRCENETDIIRLPLSRFSMGEYDWEEFRGAIPARLAMQSDMCEHVVRGVEVISAMGRADRTGGTARIQVY